MQLVHTLEILEFQFVLILSCPFPSIVCLWLALARERERERGGFATFCLFCLSVWAKTKMSTRPPSNIYFRIFMKLAEKTKSNAETGKSAVLCLG